MKLWLAWWYNGLSWGDGEWRLVGVYSTEELAKENAEKYDNLMFAQNPLYKQHGSHGYTESILLDRNIDNRNIEEERNE